MLHIMWYCTYAFQRMEKIVEIYSSTFSIMLDFNPYRNLAWISVAVQFINNETNLSPLQSIFYRSFLKLPERVFYLHLNLFDTRLHYK